MPDIKISEVITGRDRRIFIDVYRKIYRDYPHARIPLDTDVLSAIDPKRSSFLADNPHMAWIAWRDGEPVGRIMAIENKLHLKTHGDGAGHFGYLEFVDDSDVLYALISAAEEWLRGRGLSKMVGPLSPSINHESGLLIDSFDSPPAYMMNYAPPYYGAALDAAGFAPAMDMFSFKVSTDRKDHSGSITQLLERVRGKSELRIRTLDPSRYREDIDLLVDIYNDGWSGNWGSVPISKAEAHELGTLLRPLIRPQWVTFVEVDGEAIAVTLQMPDLNEASRDLNGRLLPFGWIKLLWRMRRPAVVNSRMLMLGVRQSWQRRSAGPLAAMLLIDSSFESANLGGLKTAELGWVLQTNKAILAVINKFNVAEQKTYRVYEKAL